MTFNVLLKFRDCFVCATVAKCINDALMASHGRFPFRFLDAIAKLLKEDLKHFTECDHRGQAARFEECAMESNIQIDFGLKVLGGFQLVHQFLQRIDPIRMTRAVPYYVGDNARFHDDTRVDQFLGIDLVERCVETKILCHPLPVELADDQPNPGFRMNDTQELQGFGGFSQAESADAELFSKLGFGRQAVSRQQPLGYDQLPNLFRDPVPDEGAGYRGDRIDALDRGYSLFCAGHLRPLLSIR